MEEAGAAATRAAKRARLAPTGAPVAEASELARVARSEWRLAHLQVALFAEPHHGGPGGGAERARARAGGGGRAVVAALPAREGEVLVLAQLLSPVEADNLVAAFFLLLLQALIVGFVILFAGMVQGEDGKCRRTIVR